MGTGALATVGAGSATAADHSAAAEGHRPILRVDTWDDVWLILEYDAPGNGPTVTGTIKTIDATREIARGYYRDFEWDPGMGGWYELYRGGTYRIEVEPAGVAVERDIIEVE